MSVSIDLNGANDLEVRQLQTLAKMISPNALAQFGIDGDLGNETQTDIAAIFEAFNVEIDGAITVQDAIAELQTISATFAQAPNISEATLAEAANADVAYVQNLINIIDPSLIPDSGIDGIDGPQTNGALEALLPNGMDLETASLNEIILELEGQVIDLPPRHFVEECENLTVIAREHFAEEIDAYTARLLENPDSGYPTEAEARVHAEQIAVTHIAAANDDIPMEGAGAHLIYPNQPIEIPGLQDLSEVDATLDWEALDAAVGPGGPCGGCGETPTEITTTFTDVAPPVEEPEYPQRVDLEGDCYAEFVRIRNNGTPLYRLHGDDLNESGYHLLREQVPNAHTHGSCRMPNEGGGGENDFGKDSSSLGGGPVSGGSTALN